MHDTVTVCNSHNAFYYMQCYAVNNRSTAKKEIVPLSLLCVLTQRSGWVSNTLHVGISNKTTWCKTTDEGIYQAGTFFT